MLVYKSREKSLELKMLEALNRRMIFSSLERQKLEDGQKGYEAEGDYDDRLRQTGFEGGVVNDLFLYENGAFQLDSLLFTGDRILHYDMKNFAGDHVYQDGQFYKRWSRDENNNPLLQQERHRSLLRQLMTKLGYRYPIESRVLFMNPSFVLYNAPEDLPVIFLPQLEHHFKQLGASRSFLTPHQDQFAKKLIARHKPNLFPPKVPEYSFTSLRKGIPCARCSSFQLIEQGHACVCRACGFRERKTKAILRNIQEFQLLFPQEKLTAARIHEWCSIIKSMQTIRYVLKENFKENGIKRWTYYE